MFDIDIAFPVVLVLLSTAGLIYAAFAVYLYFRFERSSPDDGVPLAISAFATHYLLRFGSLYVQRYVLLPTLLLFLMVVTLVVTIWLGTQARSKAGIRIAWAGAFTFAAFVCWTGHTIYQSGKFLKFG